MIFCSVLHTLHDFNASTYVFERSAQMYDLQTSGSVVVREATTDGKKKSEKSCELSWASPNQASGWVAASGETQRFYVDKFKSTRYRPDLHQYIPYTKDDKISVREAALMVEPRLQDLPLIFTEVGRTAKYYEVFAKLPDWKTVVKDGQVILTTSINKIEYEFRFSARDFALKYQKVVHGGLAQEFHLSPGAGLKSFSPTDDDVRVVAFAPPLPEPKYADKATKGIVAKMFDAYDRPDWLAFEMRDRDETTKVLLKGVHLRQTDGQADMTYDGKTVAVWDKGDNTLYEGKAKSVEMMNAMGATGTRLDPMVHQLVTNVNPFRALLSREAVVKISMKMKDQNGQPVTLLEAKTKTDTMNIAVRNSDGKVLSIMTGLSGQGDRVATQRVFTYFPKSEVEASTAFRLTPPSSAKRRPVAEIVAQR